MAPPRYYINFSIDSDCISNILNVLKYIAELLN